MINFNWPKDGLFLIKAENGKYWAETIAPEFLEMIDTATDGDLYALYILPAIQSLNEQVATARAEKIAEICKKVVHEKAQTN